MRIDNITITAEASKAYQKYCCAITATELGDGDVEYLKNLAINAAVKGIDELVSATGVASNQPADVKATVKSQPYMKPSQPNPPVNDNTPNVGETRQFPNKSGHMTNYTLKYSQNKGEYFWLISNEESMKYGFPKYIKYEG